MTFSLEYISLGLKIINLTLGNAPVAYFKNKALILCQYGDKRKKKTLIACLTR